MTVPGPERAESRDDSGPAASLLRNLHSRNIPGLDGLRALAVLLVIFSHFGFESVNGGLGVMMFFVLSGFLITWLMLAETDRSGQVNLKKFYQRRTLRIFPAFYAFWFLCVGIALLRGHGMHWGEAGSAFFYFSNYYLGLNPMDAPYFNHTWSLSIEEQFYLLWPFVFIRLVPHPRRMIKVLAVLIGLVWLHRAVLLLGFGVGQEYLYRAFDTRMDHLAVGCLLAVLLWHRVGLEFFDRIVRFSWLPWLTLVAIFTLQGVHHSKAYTFVVGYALEPLLIAAFLLQMVRFSGRGLWRIFEHPVTRFLGRISYPLYLYQQLVLFTARRLTADYPVALQFVFALGVTILFATASYYLVEKPFLRLKDRLH